MRKVNYLKIIIFTVIFWFSLQPATDPDTGWHLATGRYILETGSIPKTDTFTYSLPGSKYIAHSWAFDVLMFIVESVMGPVGLSIVFALLTTASMWIMANTTEKITGHSNSFILLPLLIIPVIEIGGVRPQVVSIVGLALLLHRLETQNKRGGIWQIPLLFFMWANLHGGVVFGGAIFALWIGLKYLIDRTRFETGYWLKVMMASLVASLANPNGYEVYTFAMKMVTNQTALIYNSDWVPLFSSRLSADSLVLRLGLAVGALVALLDNKHQKVRTAIALIFWGLSLRSLRFLVPLLPLVAPLVLATFHRVFRNSLSKKWFVPASLLLITLFSFEALFNKKDLVCSREPACYGQKAGMPYGAVAFIKEKNLTGNFFNFYTWGGYLEWQLPQAKFFIDGRMDNFFVGNTSFLEEFVSIDQMRDGWYEKLIAYGTDYALMPKSWQRQTTYLTEKGWEKIFEDESTIVMKMPDRS